MSITNDLLRADIDRAKAQFVEETKGHRLTVLHDDGLYRHLRLGTPGSPLFWFDVVTWPGHLTVSGDIGECHTFTGTDADMLEFFGRMAKYERPDVYYLWQKTSEWQRDAVRQFDREVFKTVTLDQISRLDYTDAQKHLIEAAVREDVFCHADENALYTALADLQVDLSGADGTSPDNEGTGGIFTDLTDNDYTRYDHHFILACLAAIAGAKAYRATALV